MRPLDYGTETLFRNPVLERLSRSHISVPIGLFAFYAAGLVYWSVTNTRIPVPAMVGLFFLGWFVFTWVEYQVHRRFYHMSTYTERRKKVQYVMHGVHHHHPKDKDRLALPPVLSVTVATVLLIFFKALIGDYAFGFTAGFLAGYASYLLVHYLVHIHRPPKNFLRVLWINHSIHHYRDGEIIFGVSSPLWDHVYGTTGRRDPNGGDEVKH